MKRQRIKYKNKQVSTYNKDVSNVRKLRRVHLGHLKKKKLKKNSKSWSPEKILYLGGKKKGDLCF